MDATDQIWTDISTHLSKLLIVSFPKHSEMSHVCFAILSSLHTVLSIKDQQTPLTLSLQLRIKKHERTDFLPR